MIIDILITRILLTIIMLILIRQIWIKPVSFRAWFEDVIENSIPYEKTYRSLSKAQINRLTSCFKAGKSPGTIHIFCDNSERKIVAFANQIKSSFHDTGWNTSGSASNLGWIKHRGPMLIVKSTKPAKVVEFAIKAINIPVLKIIHEKNAPEEIRYLLSQEADVFLFLPIAD